LPQIRRDGIGQLREVGRRHLDDGQVRDKAGRLRLVYRTPDWEDYLQLAVTEIRQFGSASIQIARRLRAMMENLIQTLHESRGVPLRRELQLLQQSVERAFPDPEDRALAAVSDFQGVGANKAVTRRIAKSRRRLPPDRGPADKDPCAGWHRRQTSAHEGRNVAFTINSLPMQRFLPVESCGGTQRMGAIGTADKSICEHLVTS
jgi:hypothetical protein